MQDVPTQQGVGTDFLTTKEHESHLVAKHRRVAHHVRTHRYRPKCELIPRKEVTGEGKKKGEGQKNDADDPVEFSGWLVGAVVEDASHMEEDRQHHEVGGPSVHISHEKPKGHRSLKGVDVIPCLRRGGAIEEHQEDAGDGEQDEEEEAQATEAEGVADLDRVSLHLHRVKVVQHAVHDHVRAVTWAIGVALTEHRPGSED